MTSCCRYVQVCRQICSCFRRCLLSISAGGDRTFPVSEELTLVILQFSSTFYSFNGAGVVVHGSKKMEERRLHFVKKKKNSTEEERLESMDVDESSDVVQKIRRRRRRERNGDIESNTLVPRNDVRKTIIRRISARKSGNM